MRLLLAIDRGHLREDYMMNRAGWLVLLLMPCLTQPILAASLDIGAAHTGISFGNSRRFNGIRINFVDRGVESIRGLNLTLWKPGKNEEATIRGLSLGIVGMDADELSGINIGGVGLAGETIRGLSFGLVGIGGGDLSGVSIGGVGIGGGRITGIAVGGIGMGATDVDGIAIGGIGIGAEHIRGLALGTIGVGTETLDGIAIGGFGVGGEDMRGVALGGIGVGGDQLEGLFIGPVGIGGDSVKGVAIAGCYQKTTHLTGFGTAAYCRVPDRLDGLTIGLFNWTGHLNGVQIGLLNYAENNPPLLRFLPIVNLHLD